MKAEDYITSSSKGIDVSELPTAVFDTRAPLWWGNLWGLVIETVVLGSLVAAYFTLPMTMSPFPPAQVNHYPINYNTEPDLTIPIINLIVLLLSLIPGVLLDLSARRRDERSVLILLPVTFLFTAAAIVLRFYEFDSLYFRWDDNAYGSVTWAILGMHLIHLFVMATEDIYEFTWVYRRGLDPKAADEITVTAVYWYWVVAVWVVLFAIVYLGPRIL
jgi:cytochrome c oxidase subunit III